MLTPLLLLALSAGDAPVKPSRELLWPKGGGNF